MLLLKTNFKYFQTSESTRNSFAQKDKMFRDKTIVKLVKTNINTLLNKMLKIKFETFSNHRYNFIM